MSDDRISNDSTSPSGKNRSRPPDPCSSKECSSADPSVGSSRPASKTASIRATLLGISAPGPEAPATYVKSGSKPVSRPPPSPDHGWEDDGEAGELHAPPPGNVPVYSGRGSQASTPGLKLTAPKTQPPTAANTANQLTDALDSDDDEQTKIFRPPAKVDIAELIALHTSTPSAAGRPAHELRESSDKESTPAGKLDATEGIKESTPASKADTAEITVAGITVLLADAPNATSRTGDEVREAVVTTYAPIQMDDQTEVIVGGSIARHAEASSATSGPGDEAREAVITKYTPMAMDDKTEVIVGGSIARHADAAAAGGQPGHGVRSVEPWPSPQSLISLSMRKERSSGHSRLVMLMTAAAVIGGAWFVLPSRGEPPTEQPPHRAPAVSQPEKPKVAQPEPATLVSSPELSLIAAPANGVKAASTARALNTASNPSTVPENAPASSKPPSTSDDVVVVTVTAFPADARFYRRGKPVSGSPMRVELKRGERQAFELGRNGFYVRKVVVDGRQKTMTVRMRREESTSQKQPAE